MSRRSQSPAALGREQPPASQAAAAREKAQRLSVRNTVQQADCRQGGGCLEPTELHECETIEVTTQLLDESRRQLCRLQQPERRHRAGNLSRTHHCCSHAQGMEWVCRPQLLDKSRRQLCGLQQPERTHRVGLSETHPCCSHIWNGSVRITAQQADCRQSGGCLEPT